MILLLACTAPTPTPTETAEPVDSAEPAPTGTGLLTWDGEASLSAGWNGTEAVSFRGDLGLGDVLCEFRYTVAGTTPRDDCAACALAFEVVLGPPEVTVPDACELAGYDDATIAALEGTRRGYGFAPDYYGHASVLLVDEGAGWDAASFADYDESAATIGYSWDHGYVDY